MTPLRPSTGPGRCCGWVKADQAHELKTLLDLHQPLMVAYLMKSQLKELWYARTERAAWWGWAAVV